MVKTVLLVCLANSVKQGGRCVAGINIETGEWVRPVSDLDDGRLLQSHYLTDEGHEPIPGNIIRIFLTDSAPQAYQPENWEIANKSWELVKENPNKKAIRVIRDSIESGSNLFGDNNASISYEKIKQSPVSNSLALIQPENPQFYVKERSGNRNQPRTVFELNGIEYDLSVTDPKWRRKIRSSETLSEMDLRYEPASAYIDESAELVFTISLGSPHKGYCHKLVAAIIPVSGSILEKSEGT